MARRSFPIRTYASAPRIASRDLSPATAGPLRSGGNLSRSWTSFRSQDLSQDPYRADPAFCGKTDPSSASEGGTPNELASTVFPK